MAISYTKIRKVMDAKLATLTGIPEITRENTKVKPSVDAWVRTTLLPAGSSVATVGSGITMRLKGLYQVDLFYPQASTADVAGAMADKVLSLFFPGAVSLVDGDLSVTVDNVSQYPAVNDKTFYKVSVIVSWYAFVKAE